MKIKMNLTRSLIDANLLNNKWMQELYTLVHEIEDNIDDNPDTSIESCKSLLESISRNILTRLDSSKYTTETTKNIPVDTSLELAKDLLSEKVSNAEYTLISKFTKAVTIINKIRNARGEISHGKILPKEIKSSSHLAKTISAFTDSFSYYILHIFISIDLSYKEELKYEDNPNFNDFLDKANPIDRISYSKALFYQDYNLYIEELKDYIDYIEEPKDYPNDIDFDE
jgi:hypothetical protein